jgi:hypothetical protein
MQVENMLNIKFLGLNIDNHLNWNNTDQMIPNLSKACHAVRSMFHLGNITPITSVYFAYFHFLMVYRIICWGNLFKSGKIFTLQKKIVTIMVGEKP